MPRILDIPRRVDTERPTPPRARRLATATLQGVKLQSAAPHAAALAATALLAAALLTGCGGGSTSSTGSTDGESASAPAASVVESGVAFARCVRSHGLPGFPDPKATGQTVRMASPSVVRSPAFQSAVHSCQRLLPKGPPGPEAPSPQAQSRMLDVSACMRRHGIPQFPDPTTSPPSNPAGYSGMLAGNGYYLAIPKSIDPSSPAFEQAAAVCDFGPRRHGAS
jgi:hypothetical protein